MESKMQYSPEETAQLQAKRMTRKLDLNDQQQKEVSAVFLEQSKLRQSKKEAYLKSKTKEDKRSWSKEERFKMANARLDRQIETKKKMKTILSTEQYEKWGKMSKRRQQNKRYSMRHKKPKQ